MFILFFFFSIYSALADERIYSSPYFIDGLHCQGLAEHVGWETLFISQEEAEAQRQLEAQEDCTELFKVFGLEKYTWMSPEELERVSAQVSQSVYFQEAQLSIKKSDLKNHIHILLNVKTKSKYVYRFGIQEKVYSLTENSRFFQRLSGELLDRSLQPNTSDIWGFNLDLGGAARDVESQPLYNKNFYFVEFYYKHQRTVGQAWTWSMVGRVNADNALIGRSFEGSLSIDNELLYSKYLRFIHGSIFGGVAAIFTPDFGYFASLYLNQNTSSYDTPILLPGFKMGYLFGQGTGTYFRTEVAGYRAFYGAKTLFDWKSTLQFDLGRGYLLSSSFNGKQTQDLILARDRIPSTDSMSNTLSFSITHAWNHADTRKEIELKAGVEKLNYSAGLGGRRVTPFVHLGYRALSDQLNLDFSFTYLPERLY